MNIAISSPARVRILATLVALVLTVAGFAHAAAATPHEARSGMVTPLCSLYVVTIATELLIADFNSPRLRYNAEKWPLLMAQARNARSAFRRAPLLVVRDRYDSLVDRLGVVGRKLLAGDRKAAYAELKASRHDLKEITAVAGRAHLACRAGTRFLYIR